MDANEIKGTQFSLIDINDEEYCTQYQEFLKARELRELIRNRLRTIGLIENTVDDEKTLFCGPFIPDFVLINVDHRERSRCVKILRYEDYTSLEDLENLKANIKQARRSLVILWPNDVTHIANLNTLTTRGFFKTYTAGRWRGPGSFWANDVEAVEDYYSTHTRIQTAVRFNMNENELRSFLRYLYIQRAASGFYGDPATSKHRATALSEFFEDASRVVEAHAKSKATMESRYTVFTTSR